MRFASYELAVFLWLIPVLAVLLSVSLTARKKAMERFAEAHLLSEISGTFSVKKLRRRNILIVAAVTFMLLALMRPQWGYEWQEIKKMGLDIIVALDVSNSMLAEDVRPNRLRRSKMAIKDLVENLRGDRIGLIAFSGTAFLQCPLTLDYSGFLMVLDDVDTLTIPVGGTSLAAAIMTAVETFEKEASEERVLIIVSDGEDHEGGIDRAIAYAKAKGVKIFCLGVGTPEGGLIPMPGERGREGYLRDNEGNVVRTRLIESTLQNIALATGGMYIRSTGAEFGLDRIYRQKLSKLERHELRTEMEKRYNDRFQIPLALALLILALEPFVGDRKRGERS